MLNIDEFIKEFMKNIYEKKEIYLKEQLKELIDRNILRFEETNIDWDIKKEEQTYKITAAQEFRLVVKDMEYIRKLEKENERKNKIIEVMRDGLQDISFYTSCQACECNAEIKSKALEQADKIANGVGYERNK